MYEQHIVVVIAIYEQITNLAETKNQDVFGIRAQNYLNTESVDNSLKGQNIGFDPESQISHC